MKCKKTNNKPLFYNNTKIKQAVIDVKKFFLYKVVLTFKTLD